MSLVGRFARIDPRFGNPYFANGPNSRKWIAARTGRESREFQRKSERRRDSCESGQVLQKFGRHLVGVWIGGVWNGHFPESEKYFSEAEISRKMPEIPQKERFSPNFRLRNLKIQSPKNAIPYPQPFHTPTTLPPNIYIHIYGMYQRVLSLSCAIGSATLGSTSSQMLGLLWLQTTTAF